MSIATLNEYLAALKENLVYVKLGSRTVAAAIPFTIFDIAGNPGAGVLAIGNTANGLVPTDAVAGYPIIGAPSGSVHLSKIEFANTVACRLLLFDRLFAAGAYSFGADITLASQPSYSSRVPGGTDFKNLELWIEHVTAFTGQPSVQVNYLDQDGNAGDTGVYATPAGLTLGRCTRIPLAAGDVGITRIDRVRITVATVGTLNVMVLRPLWQGRVKLANDGDIHNLIKTGLVQIFNASALYIMIAADSTGIGVPEMSIEVASA